MTPEEKQKQLALRMRMEDEAGEDAPPPPDVGAGETFLNKMGDAIPLVTTGANALTALGLSAFGSEPGARLTPQAKAELAAGAGEDIAPEERAALLAGPGEPGVLDNYRSARASHGTRTAAGSEQNPIASGLGTATGTAMSLLAPLPKVAVGAGASGRVLSNAATAGAYGALNGATNGKADLTRGDVGQFTKDVVGVDALKQAKKDLEEGRYSRALLDFLGAGAIGGAVTGGALGGVVEGARASGIGDRLKKAALNQGRRVLTNGADSLSSRAAVPEAAVEEAIRSGAMKPFSTTEGTLKRLGEKADEVGAEYGRIVDALEAKGVSGPDARKVADTLLDKGAKLERHTLNDALPKEYLEKAEQLLGKAGPNGEVGLRQAENLKRSMQDMARYGRVEETPLNAVRKDIASTVRQANEEAIAKAAASSPSDKELLELAEKFLPTKKKLGNLLQAEEAATRGAARGAQRNALSLTDKMMAAAGLASGNPAGLLAAGANNLARNRGTSAVATGGLGLADILSKEAAATGKLGQTAEVLSGSLGPHAPMPSPALAAEDRQKQADQLSQLLAEDPKALMAVYELLRKQQDVDAVTPAHYGSHP